MDDNDPPMNDPNEGLGSAIALVLLVALAMFYVIARIVQWAMT